jgi:formate dehydrogenase maturation protein FdhE
MSNSTDWLKKSMSELDWNEEEGEAKTSTSCKSYLKKINYYRGMKSHVMLTKMTSIRLNYTFSQNYS